MGIVICTYAQMSDDFHDVHISSVVIVFKGIICKFVSCLFLPYHTIIYTSIAFLKCSAGHYDFPWKLSDSLAVKLSSVCAWLHHSCICLVFFLKEPKLLLLKDKNQKWFSWNAMGRNGSHIETAITLRKKI